MVERKENPSRDFLLLLILFVAFRMGSVLFFRPGGYVRDYSDLIFYQSRASWQDFGFLPYRDYWSEYPPLFAWLTLAVDRIARLIPAWDDQRLWFAALFGLVTVLAKPSPSLYSTGWPGAFTGWRAAGGLALRRALPSRLPARRLVRCPAGGHRSSAPWPFWSVESRSGRCSPAC